MSHVYDRIGRGYAGHRRPDPRWAATIAAALGDARTVVNVGAGTGSYEPDDRWVLAVEPSATMVAQRPPTASPVVVRAIADALPVAPHARFDAALAILTVHHWPDPGAGLAELARVSRRQLVLTWAPDVTARFWLAREYLPELMQHEAALATLDRVVAALDVIDVQPLPVPADCTDGVLAAHWARPEAYLDPDVRAAASGLALLPADVVDRGVGRLADDLASGAWDARHGHLRDRPELDLGYRLVIAGK